MVTIKRELNNNDVERFASSLIRCDKIQLDILDERIVLNKKNEYSSRKRNDKCRGSSNNKGIKPKK